MSNCPSLSKILHKQIVTEAVAMAAASALPSKLARLFHVFADNHNTRAVDTTFNMLGVITQGDITHGSSTLGCKTGALHVQVFD